MKGFPTLKYKKSQIGGIDGAGIVVEVGQNVADFSVDDKVCFYRLFSDIGTWAEVISIPASYCAKLPADIPVEEAGAFVLPLLTAYDSLMQLNVRQGERILIHGVGGGVGFQALLVAKQMGLYAIGTGSQTDKAELHKAGLDEFIDYKTQDFSKVLGEKNIDYVFDVLGNDVLKRSILLKPNKIVSLKLANSSQMHKAGIKLPRILSWLMNMMTIRFVKLAKKCNVQLIGQVTGADGKMLERAIALISPYYVSRSFRTISLTDISRNGLNKSDIGKVIVFR